MSVEKICRRSKCRHLIDFGEAVTSLEFDEKPDYKKLIFMLKLNLLNNDIIPKSDILFYSPIEKIKPGKNELPITKTKETSDI